jgi:hypothetical protein
MKKIAFGGVAVLAVASGIAVAAPANAMQTCSFNEMSACDMCIPNPSFNTPMCGVFETAVGSMCMPSTPMCFADETRVGNMCVPSRPICLPGQIPVGSLCMPNQASSQAYKVPSERRP